MLNKKVLPEFQEFLLSRRLVQEKHLSYYAHWVSKFLFFSNKNQKLTDELKIEAFMNELKDQDKINDWQVRLHKLSAISGQHSA
ncbi:MAG: hypothetical protein HY809_02085 [Nitrospirae bacterium]|nr:hypothetical protein [Nitrospirota bacterium]